MANQASRLVIVSVCLSLTPCFAWKIFLISIASAQDITFQRHFIKDNSSAQLTSQSMESDRTASVLNLDIKQPLQLVDMGQEQDIAVLRGGQWGTSSIEQTLKGATWTFYPDGKFIFMPQQREEGSSLVPFIAGTYTRMNNHFELQGEYLHSGLSFSIDGQLRIESEVLVLEMLYTHSSQQSQQIAEIRQALTPIAITESHLPQIENGTPVGLTPSETLESSLILPETNITTVVDGVPVPSTFEISLAGTTGTQPFSGLPGKLIISESTSAESHPFDVWIATTTAETVNGWLVWQSQQDGQIASSGEMQVAAGRVQMEITPDTNLPALQWWFTLAGEDGLEIGAFAETAILTFSIEGERISGEIRASGRYSSNTEFNQPTTYTATFTGHKQKSNVEEALRTLFNTSSFNGQWNTEETK